ncbi:MAG: AAA family ATPase [Planctomycetota bacterium]
MRTNQRSLLDLYLAFVRTWILEYQLHSMTPAGAGPMDWTVSDRGLGKRDWQDSSSSLPPVSAAAMSDERFHRSGEPRPSGRSIHSTPLGSAQSSTPRSASSATSRPMPFLDPIIKSGDVDPHVPTKPRVPTIEIPRVVRSILRDCEEHWHHLALALHGRSETSGLRTLLVTGAHPGEGYTTVSIALAVALAEHAGSRVLLMDGDFANPGIAKSLGLRPKLSLDQVILEDVPVERAIVECDDPCLAILPLMEPFEFPSMTTGGRRLQHAMQSLRESYDLVVIDGGCRYRKGDPLPLLPGIDAALLVCNRATTTDEELDRIDERLLAHNVSCLGVIENEP